MGEVNTKMYLETLREQLINLKNGFRKNIQLNLPLNFKKNSIVFQINEYFDAAVEQISIINSQEDYLFVYPKNVIRMIVENLNNLIFKGDNIDDEGRILIDIFNELSRLTSILENEISNNEQSKNYKNSEKALSILEAQQKELKNKLLEVDLIKKDLENKKVNEIFEDEYKKFKLIARFYEVAFYSIVIVLIFYFLGLTFYVSDFNFLFIEASFPEKIHGKLSPEFYIQKVSLLVLSTTLAAFLLKRSFMNRRLADDAYRTAKELDALPRYMEGMPEEMQEKIRFDLAYKYFGNGIHHESYTGGENLMHENIKANTDFIKAVKDLTPKVEVPKAEAAKEQNPEK